MAGFLAASNISTALFTPSGSAPQRDEIFADHKSGLGASLAAVSLKMSKGTSSTTGPGLPVIIVFHACRTIDGICSPLVG